MQALADFSLEVPDGASIALIGPSGCGKSTLLRAAAGLQQPDAGSVRIDGQEVIAPRKGTALIFQDFGLLPWKTVLANAELGLRIQHVPKAERATRAQEALAHVGLDEFAQAYPRELSGGMQQRLALARSIAMDADVLLLDEALGALDAILREQMQDLLFELWQSRGHTQLIVTHSIEEAVFLGERIAVMSPRPGRVTALIDNPCTHDARPDDLRSSEAFFETCNEVRAALDAAHE